MSAHPAERAAERGFTLIELIVVVMVIGAMAGMMSTLMLKPLQAYGDVRLRTALTDSAEAATRRIARDIRTALPNSVRVSADGFKLELLHVADGARYRAVGGTNPAPSNEDHTNDSDWLDFSAEDDSFNVLGTFQRLGLAYSAASPASYRIAIYPTQTDVLYDDAENDNDPGCITPGSAGAFTLESDADEDQLQLADPFLFSRASPRQRLYVIDTPVTYICDTTAQTLTRYWGYAIAATQPEDPAANPLLSGSSALLANDVGGCDFRYDTATLTRAGLVTLDLTVARGGEQVRLLQQVHVSSAP